MTLVKREFFRGQRNPQTVNCYPKPPSDSYSERPLIHWIRARNPFADRDGLSGQKIDFKFAQFKN